MSKKEKITPEELIAEAKTLSQNIAKQLPTIADPATVSYISKIPFKVLSIRELMIWRVSDLSESAIKLIENFKIVGAIIVIRSIIESVALIYYLLTKVENSIENKSIEGLDDKLMRLLLGGRLAESDAESINVLTLVDHLSKIAPGVRKYYDDLSEFAHPNWSGSLGSYGTINKNEMKLEMGILKDLNSYPYEVALNSLIASLDSFRIFYNDLANHIPKFSKLCEATLKK
jgi:hypothetical protein